MVNGYVRPDGSYYECLEQIEIGDTQVPNRPNPLDIWQNGAWVAGPIPVPQTVTPLQARQALLAANLLDTINTAVSNADTATKLAWEYATVIDRNSSFVATLGAALNFSSFQLDTLFISASNFT